MSDTYTLDSKWLRELSSDLTGSDRACAVLAGAVIDDKLKELLLKYLLPANRKEDRLLGRNGAVDSFSARTELAYRLGLISADVRKSIDWLRDIRNDAAHNINFHFEQNETSDRISNIVDKLRFHQVLPQEILAEFGTGLKGTFVASVNVLALVLMLEVGEAGKTQQRPYDLLRKTIKWEKGDH